MAKAPSSVLSLQTVTEYPTVDIDGKRYQLLPADAMSIFDRITLESDEARAGAIITSDARTPAEENELGELLDVLCRKVLVAPPEVHNKLTDVQRMLLYEAFLGLPRAMRPKAEAPNTTGAAKRNGAKSLRGSRGSTAAVPPSGSPVHP